MCWCNISPWALIFGWTNDVRLIRWTGCVWRGNRTGIIKFQTFSWWVNTSIYFFVIFALIYKHFKEKNATNSCHKGLFYFYLFFLLYSFLYGHFTFSAFYVKTKPIILPGFGRRTSETGHNLRANCTAGKVGSGMLLMCHQHSLSMDTTAKDPPRWTVWFKTHSDKDVGLKLVHIV